MTVTAAAWMRPPHNACGRSRRQRVRTLGNVLLDLGLSIGEMPNCCPRVPTAAICSAENSREQWHGTQRTIKCDASTSAAVGSRGGLISRGRLQ